MGDVDGRHTRGAVLKHAVAEAPGRGTDIKAVASGNVDFEGLERVLELDAAARYIAWAISDDQIGLRLDQLTRSQSKRAVLPKLHLSGPYGRGRGRTRGKGSTLGEQRVYALTRHVANRSAGAHLRRVGPAECVRPITHESHIRSYSQYL